MTVLKLVLVLLTSILYGVTNMNTIPSTATDMDTQVKRFIAATLRMERVCVAAKTNITVAGPSLMSLSKTAVNSKREFADLIASGLNFNNLGPHVEARILEIPDFTVVKDDIAALITTDIPALITFYQENKVLLNPVYNDVTEGSDYQVLPTDKQTELLVLLDNVINKFA